MRATHRDLRAHLAGGSRAVAETVRPRPAEAIRARGGRLTFTLSSGPALSGSYRSGGFSLDGCGAALRWATQPALCQFSYQPGATS